MKALLVSGAVLASLALTPANSAALTLGGPLALNCYEAALGQTARESEFDACTNALEEEPLTARDRAATFVNRGILHMRRGQTGRAEADFNAAISIDSRLADGWLNKGFLYIADGDGEAALPLIQRGLDLGTSDRALALFARGIAHEQSGNIRAAYADLVSASRLQPDWDKPRQALSRYQVRAR